MHVPQTPCRQPEGINTPFFSELSNKVSSGETLHASAERENLISSEPGVEAPCRFSATAPPKLSCRILAGSTPMSFSRARPRSMNADGPHRKNVDSEPLDLPFQNLAPQSTLPTRPVRTGSR